MKRQRSNTQFLRPAKRKKTGRQTGVQAAQNINLKTVEYKVADSGTVNGEVTNVGTVIDIMSSLVRGTGYLNQFVGNTIKPVGIQVRYTLRAGDPTNVMRVMIVQWMDSTTPTPDDILQSVLVCSAIDVSNRSIINVLHDRIYGLPNQFTGAGSNSTAIPTQAIYIKGKHIYPVEYRTTTSTAKKGAIYMLLLSDSSDQLHPLASYYTRVTFAD